MPTYVETACSAIPDTERGILFPGNMAQYPGASQLNGRILLLLCLIDDSGLEVYNEPKDAILDSDGFLAEDPEELLERAERIGHAGHSQELTLYVGDSERGGQVSVTLMHHTVFYKN